jgi:hypothetical protein
MENAVTTKSYSRLLRNMLLALVTVSLLALGYVSLVQHDAFIQHVTQKVKAGVPIGTPRNKAESWAVQTFGFLPSYRAPDSDDRSHGPTLMQRAGVPKSVPGGVIEFLAKRRDPLGRGLDQIRSGHVWVFLLLDNDGCVQDYRFFSFGDLREMEREI